jgi:hypothetical protein
MLHKVRDLPTETRGVVESLIGRPLRDDEAFSIRPLRLQKEGVDAATANVAADQLEQYFAEIDAQHPPVSPGEAAEAIDEALRNVRPGHTPLQ